jgi:hypothetical protein
MMSIKIAFAAAALAFAALLQAGTPARAASISLKSLSAIAGPTSAQHSTIQKIAYRNCRRWRQECVGRWGWHTHRYRRCMRYHGCGYARPHRVSYCRNWHHDCASRWGWKTHRYYGCARRHGC